MAKSRPKIILSVAMSIDGKIATSMGYSNFSSKKDIKRIHKLRSQVDAILVGKKTVKIDDPLLTVRYVRGKNPVRIILSSLGDIPTKSRIFKTAKQIPTIIACSENISKKNQQRLQSFSVDIIQIGADSVNIKKLLSILYKRGIKSILLEGGGTTNWEFIKQDLVDEILLAITPFVVGGKNSISVVDGQGFPKISNLLKFHLKQVNRFKNELVVRYVKL